MTKVSKASTGILSEIEESSDNFDKKLEETSDQADDTTLGANYLPYRIVQTMMPCSAVPK